MEKEIITPNIEKILLEYSKALDKRQEYELGFNLFSLISDTYHYENFHSNILYHILNPNGKHKQNYTYLNLFIQYIKEHFGNINTDDYKNAEVHEEYSNNQRRIDLLIISRETKKAIIIENKINGAIDMDNQIPAYYEYICETEGCTVDAVIYLSLDGKKYPDLLKWSVSIDKTNEIKAKILQFGAFDIPTTNKDIYNGWLQKCIDKTKECTDEYFVLKQYRELLKSLRGYIMETNELEKLFNEISSDKKNVKNFDLLINAFKNMYLYVGERFADKLISKCIVPNLDIRFSTIDHLIIEFTADNFYKYYLKLTWSSINYYELQIMQNSLIWNLEEILNKSNFYSKYGFDGDSKWSWKIWSDEKYNIFDIEQEEKLLEKIENIIIDLHKIVSDSNL